MTAPLMPDHSPECDWVLRQNTCSCNHPRYLRAVETVAFNVIAKCVEWTLGHDLDWEEYPELPEFVWADVTSKVRDLTTRRYDNFAEAYDRLADLATEEA